MSKSPIKDSSNESVTLLNFIDNEFVEPRSAKFMDNVCPYTGKVYGKLPESNADDVEAAVKAAEEALPGWRQTSEAERSRLLLKVADLVEENLEAFAMAESRDNGKPYKLALAVDIPRVVSNFRFYATAIIHREDMASHMNEQTLCYERSEPVGVCALISPWNLPLYLLSWKIAPALACGNTCVCKPSEFTSLTAYMLCEVIKMAGIPKGVCNIVFGTGLSCGAALVEHQRVRLVSFTGGTATGGHIMRACANSFKKVSLELGGKNANLVFADADMEKTVNVSVRAAFANQGEICLCGSRIFVERSAYDAFLKAFVEQVQKLVVGDPRAPTTTTGALVSKQHLEKVESYAKLAVEEGGKVLCGGKRPNNLAAELADGFYFLPTVISELGADARTCTEEIFGPIVTVTPFDTEEEAVRYANSVQYGLSATLFTSSLDRAHRVAARLDVGTCWVNCWLVRDLRVPFGGQKSSGIGREGGKYALDFYTEQKTVCIQYQ